MSRPLFVLGSTAELAAVVRRLAGQGWVIREGFRTPDEPWDLTTSRLVFTGPVTGTPVVADVVLAAARGAGVATVVDPDTETGRLLLTDLGRIGTVTRSPDERADVGETLPLTEEQRALLERLADGESIAAAAAAEFLSLRTANRRIAAARDALGVRTTRQAVVEYVRRRS
ncbi:MAG TPA: hypothetical protein VGR21_05720 [Cryptosporangiaceae bacterium]|nr:hypothetical protein [Cryptosporangiaceae bacterium]